MKKKIIGILLILLITFTLGIADVKYYWYEPSDEDSVAVDVYEETEPDNGEWDPGGSWNPGGNWVLFATSGDLEIKNDPSLIGRGGYFGSNCSPDNRNDFSSFGWQGEITHLDNFYIGHDQFSQDVIDIFSNPNIHSGFYDCWENDKFKKLPQPVSFNDPSDNFPLKTEHFNPGIELEYKDRPDEESNGGQGQGNAHGHGHGHGNNNTPSITISNSIHYGELDTTNYSDERVILEVGSDDLVVQIDNLTVGDSTEFVIQSSENVTSSGRVFLFVGNSNKFDYTLIGNETYADKTFFFYSGNEDLSLSGDSRLYGSVYLKNSGFSIDGGSGGLIDLVSKAAENEDTPKNIILNSDTRPERLLRSVYAVNSNISVENDGPITGGFVTGGESVYIGTGSANSINPSYIYAPNAHITFKYDNVFTGSYIGESILLDSWGITIQGPPTDKIEKPVIPRPNPPAGSGGEGDGDWLITLNLNLNEISTGELALKPIEEGVNTSFNSNGAVGDFTVYFTENSLGHFQVTWLWKEVCWTWSTESLKENGFVHYEGHGGNPNNSDIGNPNYKILHIIPNDYKGNITIVDESSIHPRVKIDNHNGKFKGTNGAPVNPGHGGETIEIK